MRCFVMEGDFQPLISIKNVEWFLLPQSVNFLWVYKINYEKKNCIKIIIELKGGRIIFYNVKKDRKIA